MKGIARKGVAWFDLGINTPRRPWLILCVPSVSGKRTHSYNPIVAQTGGATNGSSRPHPARKSAISVPAR